MNPAPPTLWQARSYLVLAAVLWSAGSLMKVLTEPTGLGLHEPKLDPVNIAFWRSLFAGLALLPLIRPRDLKFRPLLPAMVLTFGLMSGLYLTAMGLGSAANAILLQNSAPIWVYLVGVGFLGHARDSRSLQAIGLAMIGAAVIFLGNWPTDLNEETRANQIWILAMAAGSGVAYAGVILFLGHFRDLSPAYLAVLNLLGSALILGLVQFAREKMQLPTVPQLGFLALFGALQLAAPYWLFARGLQRVSPQEAGIITLLEPVLNPIWAFLIAPGKETPPLGTWIGGGLLLAALAWRYVPGRKIISTPGEPGAGPSGPYRAEGTPPV